MKIKEQIQKIQDQKEFLQLTSRFAFFDRSGRLYLDYANLYLSEVKKIGSYSYLGFLFFLNRKKFTDFNKAVLGLKKTIDKYDDHLEKGEGAWDKLVEFEKAMLNLGHIWRQMETTLFWNTLSKKVERNH